MSVTGTSAPATTPHAAPHHRLAWSLAGLLVATLIVLPSGLVTSEKQTAAAKLDLALQPLVTVGGDQPVRVIVSAVSGRVQDAEAAVTGQGAVVLDRFDTIGAVSTVVAAADLSPLAADRWVRNLSSDGLVESAQFSPTRATRGGTPTTSITTDAGSTDGTTNTAGDTGGNWQIDGLAENHLLNTLGLAEEPWDGTDVNVAIIDSGVQAFHDMPIWSEWTFLDGANPAFNRSDFGVDPYGHGTHVAGLVANSGWQSGGLYRGVADGVGWLYSLRVLDDRGVGRTSDVIRAIEWVLANQRRAEVDIINLSLGHPILEPADRDPLVQAVEAAVRAGIVVVVSAGNYGYNRATGEIGYAGVTSPGNAPSAITVGAVDTFRTDTRLDDVVARYSSRGPTWYDGYAKPDIVAPGSSLTATTSYTSRILQENPQLEVETEYIGETPHIKLSGTSMAAVVTTGVVAQMIHAQRKTFGRHAALTPNAIKAMLHYTALDMGEDVLTQGAGSLNGDGAVALAARLDSTTAVGQWWLTQGVSETSTIDGTTHTWSQRLVWGDRLIWGNQEVYTNEEAWGLRIVWGDRLVWGDRIIWGNVTADRLIWGNLDDGSAGTMGVR